MKNNQNQNSLTKYQKRTITLAKNALRQKSKENKYDTSEVTHLTVQHTEVKNSKGLARHRYRVSWSVPDHDLDRQVLTVDLPTKLLRRTEEFQQVLRQELRKVTNE